MLNILSTIIGVLIAALVLSAIAVPVYYKMLRKRNNRREVYSFKSFKRNLTAIFVVCTKFFNFNLWMLQVLPEPVPICLIFLRFLKYFQASVL